jgi:hypothetical protein
MDKGTRSAVREMIVDALNTGSQIDKFVHSSPAEDVQDSEYNLLPEGQKEEKPDVQEDKTEDEKGVEGS